MVSRNKIVTTVIILLLLSVLLSGCTGKKIIAPAPDSIQKEAMDVSSQNVTRSSKEENVPEISITSFSSVYMHDNSEQKDIYLFSWENVPGNESDRLRSFFRDYFLLNWVENAQITKDKYNKTIRVFDDENSINIILDNEIAQIVQISFEGTYGWPTNSRMSFNNQDVILDDGLNITVVRSESSHFLS